MQTEETIAAIATTCESGGLRGIVRLSGPGVLSAISPIFRCEDESTDLSALTSARRIPGQLSVSRPMGNIPCDLFLWPTTRSFTRQPTAELHTFGAVPLLNAVVDAVCQHGARLAQPGEFTLRAFLAGRIDLAQAEAVLGVIDAADNRELHVALTQLAGGLSQPIDQLRDSLLNLVADLEAGLDFVDEDIDFISQRQVEHELEMACDAIEIALQQMRERGQTGQLPRLVLLGEPNVGKSSLWNALCDDAQAIVTDTAGTTRDYLTGTVTGRALKLIDTAGVEARKGGLNAAVRQTTDDQVATAELVLLCLDATRPLTAWEKTKLDTASTTHQVIVLTKCDLPMDPSIVDLDVDVQTSVRDVESLKRLVDRCEESLEAMRAESSVVANTAVRCRDSLSEAGQAVERGLGLARSKAGDELVAAEVRVALEHLGRIVGAIYTDDILDRVFSRFCIGK